MPVDTGLPYSIVDIVYGVLSGKLTIGTNVPSELCLRPNVQVDPRRRLGAESKRRGSRSSSSWAHPSSRVPPADQSKPSILRVVGLSKSNAVRNA